MNILLTAILLLNAVLLAVILFSFLKVRAVYRDIVAFITPAEENKPSALATLIMTISDNFARSMIAQAKATFMGIQSGNNRAEKAIEADIALDTLAIVNPTISAILNSFPSVKKTVRRNPQMLDAVISRLGSNSQPNEAGNNHKQFDFKL